MSKIKTWFLFLFIFGNLHSQPIFVNRGVAKEFLVNKSNLEFDEYNKRGDDRYKIKLGEREIPISTLNEKMPDEKQLSIIKKILTEDFLVNDDTSGGALQYTPKIGMDSNGNFVIVWYDNRNGNYDIYYQRYNSLGIKQGVNEKVNDDVGSANQYFPSVSMDGSGNFVIVWSDERNGNSDIYYQRYNNLGIKQGVNEKVNDDVGSAYQYYPSVSMDGSGNFVIVWYDNRNGNYDIYYQRYNSLGIKQGVNEKVNDDVGSANQYFPSVSMDGSGNFVIVWEDRRNGNYDIYYQRYNDLGIKQGVNEKVNDDDVGSAEQRYPSVSMDGSGNFVIVWTDFRFGNPDIFGQRYFSNGLKKGTNYKMVADGPNYTEISPKVSCNSDKIVFIWMDNRRSKGYDIYGKIVDWNWGGVTSADEENNIPTEYVLHQNYPNPFNSKTKIRWSVPNSVYQTLKVYDILGNEIMTLADGYTEAGNYSIEFDGSKLSSGVYIYKLQAGEFVQIKKMILLK